MVCEFIKRTLKRNKAHNVFNNPAVFKKFAIQNTLTQQYIIHITIYEYMFYKLQTNSFLYVYLYDSWIVTVTTVIYLKELLPYEAKFCDAVIVTDVL